MIYSSCLNTDNNTTDIKIINNNILNIQTNSNEKLILSLYSVDGKLIKESLSSLNPDDIDSIIELKEPIYFINGVEYSEESLFGENPTSPYAPLTKQKIEKIEIIQPADAVKIYGKKGEKGVVIISIKE